MRLSILLLLAVIVAVNAFPYAEPNLKLLSHPFKKGKCEKKPIKIPDCDKDKDKHKKPDDKHDDKTKKCDDKPDKPKDKCDDKKPDVPKPDVPKSDCPKPDVPKPDVPKPDDCKNDKPDVKHDSKATAVAIAKAAGDDATAIADATAISDK